MAGVVTHRLLAAALVISSLSISSLTLADEVMIGTGTGSWYCPLYTGSHDARTQTIYLASEIGNSYNINSLALYVTTIPGQVMNNFTIRVRHTDLSVYGSSPVWESTGWTTVYQMNQTISTTGWLQFSFSTPFQYDGGHHVMVDICFNNSSCSSIGYCRYTDRGVYRSIFDMENSSLGDPLTWSGRIPWPSISYNVPNIKLGVAASGSVAAPMFSPDPGTYNTAQNVAVACLTSGATVHYTTNGVDPTESDPIAEPGVPVPVSGSLTLRARAWKDGLAPSVVRAGVYSLVVAAPVLSPGGGSYTSEPNVTITCSTPGATLRYTTDGSDPNLGGTEIASGASISIDHSLVLKVVAMKPEWSSSGTSATYALQVATPGFSVGSGTFNTERNVVITCVTPGAAIHYTTNGVDPIESDPIIASGQSVYVDRSMTLKAKAWKGAMTPSAVGSATFTVRAGTPAFTPGAGTYTGQQSVAVACATPGATIHYTINGADPTESDPVIEPNVPILVDHSLMLAARAWKGAMTPSFTRYGSYMLIVATPVFAPEGGGYDSDQDVVVTCSTAGATIYYTTNGADPDPNYDPTVASGGSVHVSVEPPTVLKARAYRTGFNKSTVTTGTYRKAVVYYVTTDGNDVYGEGLSWATAKSTLQGALDVAGSGDEIWVAAGTYYPTSDYGLVAGCGQVQARLKHFRMKNGVGIYGGFAGTETSRDQRDWKSNVTILSGDIGVTGDASDNCYHVFYHPQALGLDNTAVLDGFTITGGNADLNCGYGPPRQLFWYLSLYPSVRGSGNCGGGMYNSRCAPKLAHCIFADNTACDPEGVMLFDIEATGASYYPAGWGGAIFNADPNVSGLVLEDCIFIRNFSINGGGGICDSAGDMTVTRCTFVGNTLDDYHSTDYLDGGNAIVEEQSSLSMTNCVVVGNAGRNSIAVWKAGQITGCTMAYNAGGYGVVWARDPNYAVSVTNCLIWGNEVYYPSASVYGTVSVAYSDIQGGFAGTGNINADPLFVRNPGKGADNQWGTADDGWGDLRLRAGSPCVDAGNNIDANSPTDLAGYPRIVDGNGDANSIADMGAYERQCVANPVGDVSYDCGVEFVDYAMLAGRWGQSGCTADNWWCYRADVDESGTVDIVDVALLVEHWLEGK